MMNPTPLISIIIPCYNSAAYLQEALTSAKAASGNHIVEIIVVDDGSNEPDTIALLTELEQTNSYIIIRQKNGGPAAARNTGVKNSNGKYLLFLDSDNKIRPEFINATLPVLEKSEKTAVVYGDVEFFGVHKYRKEFNTGMFDLDALISNNYIDVCSLVRRESFDQVSGFDESRLLIGFEDWELWVHLASKGWYFTYLPVVLFDYRLRDDSVFSKASQEENYLAVKKYIYKKHSSLVMERYNVLYHETVFYKTDKKYPLRSFLKYLRAKYLQKKSHGEEV